MFTDLNITYLSISVQFMLRVEGWVKICSEGSLPSATAELEAAVKKHQELNEEISANYTQVCSALLSHLWPCTFLLLDCSEHPPFFYPICLQVSESGKALMDVLQRSSASESDESTTKPDFTAATHTIMGVLHQVMQVRFTVNSLN